ncbi:hypothetical protein BLNAU_21000 [Blattamonas nauphoetae]|uniref:Protein kinase domain-containing protein n=1 Tax=Blattamonas nauphoetae TaxID=2049346 RepID=A0ABQ9WXN5_9EUKA|nr:hypothetical protein BLNAU_21000 [Blattamonas nauphoetae]
MTSSTTKPIDKENWCDCRQIVSGCDMMKSTNHLYGTLGMDINTGMDFLFKNTTFSNCLTDNVQSNAEETIDGKHFVTTGRKSYTSTNTYSSITFSFCTFRSMTYHHTLAIGGGGAISVYETAADLTVADCAFSNCNITGDAADGGAVNFHGNESAPYSTMRVSRSAFHSCYAKDCGGAVSFGVTGYTYLDNCAFYGCSCGNHGGSISIQGLLVSTLSDITIEKGTATVRGGGCYLDLIGALSLSSVSFRGCTCTNEANSRDIIFGNYSVSTLPRVNVSNCDSSSGSPNVVFRTGGTSDSVYVPQVTKGMKILTTAVTHESDTATVTVTTLNSLKGKMNVLLSGGSLPRLVQVTFAENNGAGSKVGIGTTTSGADGVLQSAVAYTALSSVISGHIPSTQFVYEATASLDASGNSTTVVVSGISLPSGSYSVVMKDSAGQTKTITPSLSGTTTLTQSFSLYPTPSTLKFGETYTLTSVICGATSILLNDVKMTTPIEPTRIERIQDEKLNGEKTAVSVMIVGRQFGGTTMTLKMKSSSGEVELTKLVTVLNVTHCVMTLPVSESETSTQLKFGTEYEILDASSTGSGIFVNSNVKLVVPDPPIVTSISAPLTCAGTTFEVSVVGTKLPKGKTFKATLNSSHTFLVSFSSAESGSGTIKAGLESEVQFNTEYLMTSLVDSEDGSDEIVLVRAPKFVTPVGPTISKVEALLSLSTIENISIVVTGSNMIATGFELVVSEAGRSNEITIPVTFSDDQTGIGEAVVFGSTELKYGTNYSVISVKNSVVIAALEGTISFLTPATPPRITSSKCVLGDTMKTKAKITIVGEGFPSKTAFSIGLIERSSDGDVSGTDLRLSSTFGGLVGSEVQTNHELWEEVYGSEGKMKYGAEYRITDLSISGYRCGVNAAVTLKVDPAPARVTDISSSLTGDREFVVFVLTCEELDDSEEFSAEISLSSSPEQVFEASACTFVSPSSLELRVAVDVEGTSGVKYGTTYSLKRVFSSTVNVILHKTDLVVPDPPIVTLISAPLTCAGTTFEVSIVGTKLPEGKTFKATLNSSHTFLVSFSSTESGSGSIKAGLESEVQFNTEYLMTSLVDSVVGSDEIVLVRAPKFVTPVGPTISKVEALLSLSTIENISIVVTGSNMIATGFVLVVCEAGTSNEIRIPVTFSDSQTGTGEAVVFGSTELKYGTNYSVISVKNSVVIAALEGTISFLTPATPPRITSSQCVLGDTMKTKAKITIVGEGFPSGTAFSIGLIERSSDGDVSGTDLRLSSTFGGLVGSEVQTNHELWEEVYGSEGKMKYGAEYRITDLSISGYRCGVNAAVTLKVDPAPARVTDISSSLTGDREFVVFVLTCEELDESNEFSAEISLSSSPEQVFESSACTFVSASSLELRVAVDVEGTSGVKYGTTYSLKRVFSSTVNVILHKTDLVVPDPPIVTLITAPLTCAGTTFEVSIVGTKLPEGKTFKATLNSSHTFLVSFSSAESGSGSIKAGLEAEVQFNTEYLMSSLVDSVVGSDEIVLVRAPKFLTPVGPTISKVEALLSLSTIENISIVVTGSNMIATGFVLVVCEAGTSNEIRIPVTFSDSQTGTGEAVVFGSTELKYGTNYSVISVKNSVVIAALEGTISFLTPATPPRITSSQCVLGDTMKTKAKITIVGEGFPSGTAFSIGLIERSSDGDVSGTDLRLSSTFGGLVGSEVQTNHELWEEVYGSEGKMKYGAEYRITDLSISGYRCGVNAAVTLKVDPAPARVTDISSSLTGDREFVVFVLTCEELDESNEFSAEISLSSSPEQVFESSACTFVSASSLELRVAVDVEGTSGVKYGTTYSLKRVFSSTVNVILHKTDLIVPNTPKITKAEFDFSNSLCSTCVIKLIGEGLPTTGVFIVELNGGLSFDISFSSSTDGQTSEMLLGYSNTLNFSETYPIISVKDVLTSEAIVVVSPVEIKTKARPTELIVFADSLSTDSSGFCGTKERACSSIDSAWKLAQHLGCSEVTIRLKKKASQTKAMVCGVGMNLLFENGSNTEPTLEISKSASMGEEKGMIVMENGSLEFVDIDIVFENSMEWFVLIALSNSTLLLKDGSIVGRESSSSNTESSVVDDLCNWQSGVILSKDSNITVNLNEFHGVSQGVFNVKGGSLSIRSSSFDSNSPHNTLFPSARRNIHCSENGLIEIGSLNGGDGTGDTKSGFISSEDCTVTSTVINPNAPLFIPTLSSKSSSSLDKKTGTFSIVICGSTLIPCGLSLEVFEMNKNKSEGEHKELELNLETTSSFTETEIVLSLALSSLSLLSPSLEWRGRLRFGENLGTSESFVIQKSSSDRFSQSTKDNMKWWLPVAIVVGVGLLGLILIIYLCCRRRKEKEQKSKMTKAEELDCQDDIEKMDVEDYRDTLGRTMFDSTADAIKGGELTRDKRTDLIRVDGEEEDRKEQAGDPKVMDVIVCDDKIFADTAVVHMSLFDAFHKKGHRPLPRRSTEQKLVRGLHNLSRFPNDVRDLSKLSPHRVFINGTELAFKLKDEDWNTTKASFGTNVGEGKAHEEIRWRSPEEAIGEKKEKGGEEKEGAKTGDEGIDHGKVSVFRLGLILFEIETGTVPFGETDAMNASRQLCSGMLPPLDGVRSSEMKTLICDCLTISVDDRPTLGSVLERVNSIDCDEEDVFEIFISH